MTAFEEPELPTTEFERRFERWRAGVGAVLAPIIFVAILSRSFPNIGPEAHRLAAIMGPLSSSGSPKQSRCP